MRLLHIDWWAFIRATLYGCLTLGSAVALAATSAWLIARASQHPSVLHLTVAATSVRMFGVSRAVMRYIHRLASHKVALEGMDHLRRGVYAALAVARVDRVTSVRRGDLLARAGADVDDVGDLVVKAFLPACVSAIVGVGTVIGVSLVSLPVGLILAGCLCVSGVVAPLVTMHAVRVAQRDGAQARADLAAGILTIIEGAAHLQVSGRLSAALAGVERAEDRVTDSVKRASRIQAIAQGVDRLAMGVAVLAAIILGGPGTTAAVIPAVMLAVIVLTPLAAFEGTSELGAAASQVVRSATAAVRIYELIGDEGGAEASNEGGAASATRGDSSTELAPAGSSAAPSPATPPTLVAKDLSIGWPGGPIIASGISLQLHPGSRLGIVGPSGIGKTTLLLTLAGLLPPRSGSVTLGGRDVSSAPRPEVTQSLTVTTEDAHIFATSVLENLRVARASLTPEEAGTLLETVGLSEWVAGLSQGLDTPLGTGGTTISGGERRRLLMARALAAPAPLLLLDEAAEHLDNETADALVATLFGGDSTRGVAIVSHRLSALDHADEILVLGRPDPAGQAAEPDSTNHSPQPAQIIARGRHADIVASSPEYRWALDKELS
ncbi:MAG: thiol reductant ABC exporter subunit CydC [Actinomycetaceae bacterium]|nr:thiol reductant ABC exporter subunit CydC [Actinomycetaceae bacterium]